MFPTPFEKFIPRFYERDDKLVAFADKHDEIIEAIKNGILSIDTIFDPVRMPAIILEEVGYFLNAGIKQGNTEREKRVKIAKAIKGHKVRGSFDDDAKPKIDNIAGGDSQILMNKFGDEWVIIGDGLTLSSAYWGSIGCDGIDDELGLGLLGEGTEIEIAGNIYIDVDNDSLTVDDVAKIRLELEKDVLPNYMRIFIGYLDISDNFIIYDIIE